MKKWKCEVCGYIHDGDEVCDKCPKCGVSAEKFQALEDELLMREMDEALERAKNQKRYTSEEVDAMMAEILSRNKKGT